MHRVVPELIVENYRAGRYSGQFPAVAMFLDLSGFSTMTDTLMQHGQHGAEVLAGLMHGVFDPLVESIFDYGGKIVGFAGDGIMALYPVEGDVTSVALRALTSAQLIQKRFQEHSSRQTEYGEFSIYAKIGLGCGTVFWSILRSSHEDQAAYYFRGSAVDESAEAEHHAKPGEILLTSTINEILQDMIHSSPSGSFRHFEKILVDTPAPSPVAFPPVDLHITRLFMPEQVILEDVRGEFRQVVNLFMRFPDLSEEALQRLMSTVFELRTTYGGLVSRLDFGDKGCNMLMLWGAPIAYENDIGRALNFLLDLKSKVDVPITAGVTYYIAHAGYLGSSMYEDYTCYGWGVNLASRFMMSARPGEVWVDDRIARRVARNFELDFVGSQRFKGFASEQKVYLLRGYTQTREPAYQGEMVGRKHELQQLASFLEPLWQDTFAGMLLLTGEAGTGKGRLIHELRSSMREKGKKLLWAVCQPNQEVRQSFNPLRGWLFRYFGISRTQPEEEQKQAFDEKLDELLEWLPDAELKQEIQRIRSVLGALLNLRWEGSLYEQLDAEGRHNNTFLALIALLKAESLRQPVVVVLEDFQFADKDSKDLLPWLRRAILAAGGSYPIAIIIETRPPRLDLARDLIDMHIELRPLSREDLRRLAEIRMGGDPAPSLVRFLADRSEGNPYFAEQILVYLQEEKLIETSPAGWHLVRKIDETLLPSDIRSVLVARFDQLPRGVRDCIQIASVLGREFELPVLMEMWRRDDQLSLHVAEAEKAAIWRRVDDVHFVFSHGLLRDAAYEMQMQARRQELHRVAVDALELRYSDVPNRYAEIAYHARYGGLSEKALRYYRLAGQVAADAYQNHQAVEYYSHALALTPRTDLAAQFDILIERVEMFNRVGNRSAQRRDIETLERLAVQLADSQRMARVEMTSAHYYNVLGDFVNVAAHAERAVAHNQKDGDARIYMDTYAVWSVALLRMGKLEDAMQYARRALTLARAEGTRLEEGKARSIMGLITLEQKEPRLARAHLEEAVKIARELKDLDLEAKALNNLAMSASSVLGDFAAARSYYEMALEINRQRGDSYGTGVVLANLGYLAGLVGDFESAQAYHERALSTAREIGSTYQEIYTLINLSAVTGVKEDALRSLEYASRALELSRRIGERSGEGWALLYMGYAWLLSGETEPAVEAFQGSIAIREELGQPALKTEPLAGLIQAALLENDVEWAITETEKIIAYLDDGGTLEGTEEPLRVYYACYLALERTRDPRSSSILRDAMQLLDAQVANLADERAREMFVENVPWRSALQRAAKTLEG